MSKPAIILFQTQDERGLIRVFDNGDARYLQFGNGDQSAEQSSYLYHQPLVPQHEYSRAMLLVLLWIEPKRSLSLGLGAGLLNSCLHRHNKSLKQDIVELRQSVVDIAYNYFQLPRSKHINVHIDDASTFLQGDNIKKNDIIFSDIYDHNGLDESQLSESYISNCLRHLKPQGCLVLNCWQEHRNFKTLELLKQHFNHISSVATTDGNWVVFASNKRHDFVAKQLKQKVKQLGLNLGFPLAPYLNRLEILS